MCQCPEFGRGSFRELRQLTAIGPVVYWWMVKLSGEGTELGGLGGGGTGTRAEMGEDAWSAGTVEVWWCGGENGGQYYIGWRQKMAGAVGGGLLRRG